jgi:hypothetical protein
MLWSPQQDAALVGVNRWLADLDGDQVFDLPGPILDVIADQETTIVLRVRDEGMEVTIYKVPSEDSAVAPVH